MSKEVWTYWITRDSTDGEPASKCDLWSYRPTRTVVGGRVRWEPKTENSCYLGEQDLQDLRRWFGTYSDTDLECIVVEQYAHDVGNPKAKKQVRK